MSVEAEVSGREWQTVLTSMRALKPVAVLSVADVREMEAQLAVEVLRLQSSLYRYLGCTCKKKMKWLGALALPRAGKGFSIFSIVFQNA